MRRIARKLLPGVTLAMAGLQAQALVITGADCGTTLTCWPGSSGPPANTPAVADIEAVTGSTKWSNRSGVMHTQPAGLNFAPTPREARLDPPKAGHRRINCRIIV